MIVSGRVWWHAAPFSTIFYSIFNESERIACPQKRSSFDKGLPGLPAEKAACRTESKISFIIASKRISLLQIVSWESGVQYFVNMQ